MCVCVCVGARKAQKEALSPLDLVLQMWALELNRGPLQEPQLSSEAASLKPRKFHCIIFPDSVYLQGHRYGGGVLSDLVCK